MKIIGEFQGIFIFDFQFAKNHDIDNWAEFSDNWKFSEINPRYKFRDFQI